MKNKQKSYNVWDWIVTKTGEVRQITHDDMMDLKGEDIERLANDNELPVDAIMKKIRGIADKHAGVEKERETLNNYTQLPLDNTETPRYSQYTVLKAMKEHADKQTSELKQQKDELLEALTKGRDMCDMLRFPTEEELKLFSKMATELIQKLSNNDK